VAAKAAMTSREDRDHPNAQDEVIAFLRRPASYGLAERAVETVETHISIVFLAGEHAYKLKRAVKYPYLDFSTPDLRQAACNAELTLNRRTAPELYLEVRAIGHLSDGTVGWGGGGSPLDWVVVMRRFEQRQLLDEVTRAGGLSAPLMLDLAAQIAAFHREAEPHPDRGGAAVMAEVAETNIGILRDHQSAGFPVARIDALAARLHEELARCAALLDERRARGKVRRCHGDLHLGNICLFDGKLLLFDALEFSETIASIDVLYDFAFLLMDLMHRGQRDLANLTLNRYLDLTGEDDGLAAMPAFLSLRAVIRGHVIATAAEHGRGSRDRASAFAEARRYVEEAAAVLRPAPARLVAIGGLSGSGKSSLALRLAPELGVPPGARVLRSDVLRKRRFGLMPEERLPPEAYRTEVTALVYRELCERAVTALKAGYAAVIDAVALREDERRDFVAVAAAAGVPFTGLWLDAPAETMRARVGARRADASDASVDVLDQQLQADPGALDWDRIDASGGPDATLMNARRALGLG
jgi:aminoglycoside phosphotransferase family enzyme/predicted kinase